MNNRYIAIFVIIIVIVVGVLFFSYKKDAPVVVPPTPEVPIASSTPAVTATSTATSTATTTTTKPVVKPTTPVVTPKPTPTPTPAPTVKSYTLTEISTHNSKTSCWTTVKGKVYDITAYVPKHPGGVKEIMQVCGKDGTFLFEDQHSGDKKPNNVLVSFEIGILI